MLSLQHLSTLLPYYLTTLRFRSGKLVVQILLLRYRHIVLKGIARQLETSGKPS
jgi:hypothetical protein